VTCFPPSNYSKSKNKNVYIIIANGYTTKEVSQSSYLIRGRKKKLRVCKREAGGGLGAKSDETERDGSVSGTPCETAVEGDGGRWWDEVDEVVVVVGLCVRKREAGEGAGAKSDETERDGSVSGAPCETAVEGDGGRWWDEVDEVVVVVGLCVRKREAGGGLGPNPTKPSAMARFRVRRVKRRWRAMGGGGG
jgi:hypothetical protein